MKFDKLLYLLVFNLSLVYCQFVRSPCPSVFNYERDDTGIYGRIVVGPGVPVSRLILQANFTVTAEIFDDYYGRLELDNERFALTNYNRGSPMRYRVHFPVTSPLPRLTWIAVNGQTICSGPGDVLRPNQYLSTFTLQHTSFIRGGPVFIPPQPPTNVNDLGEMQVYTFDGSDNTWNNVDQTIRPSRPIYVDNNFNDNYNTQEPPNRVFANPVVPNLPPPSIQQTSKRPSVQEMLYYPPKEITNRRPTISRPSTEEVFYYPPLETTRVPPTNVRPIQVNRPDSSSEFQCGVVGAGGDVTPLIVNGTPYNRGDVPWLVAIYKFTDNNIAFNCGGTLVTNKHVVTAAHCLQLRSRKTDYTEILVKIGVYDLSAWDDDITVTRKLQKAQVHPKYDPTTLENDIAVLTFNMSVQFNRYIRPACLWSGDTSQDNIVKVKGIIAGWGDKQNGDPQSGIPNMVHIPVVKTETCKAANAAFHQLTSPNTLCAGDLKGSGPCKGDSGGGLYIKQGDKWRLRGIVSISLRTDEGTCNLYQYLVLTDAAQYLPWLRQMMQE